MALLYRMGTGNGSGGDLKPYIVQFTCDSGYIGQTLTMTYKGTPHAGETVDNVSGTVASDGTLTLYPMHSGNWECSCYSSVTGTTMKKTIELSYWGTTNVEFNDIPNGATVTPIDDVQTWLHCANVWNKSYTTISEVVADTTTLNTLIANENANDYLVRSTTFATDICNNESAMTYIGLNDYCANKLLADSTWFSAICNSAYFEKVLNVKVPTLNVDNGKAFSVLKSNSPNFESYMAFNGVPDTAALREWFEAPSTGYLCYEFDIPIKVAKFSITTTFDVSTYIMTGYEIIATNDSNLTNWDVIKRNTDTIFSTAGTYTFNTSENTGYYKYWGIRKPNSDNYGYSDLQFYGREEA